VVGGLVVVDRGVVVVVFFLVQRQWPL